MFFCDKFFKWVNTFIPNKFPSLKGDHPRLVIPFLDKEDKMFALQGRAFGKEEQEILAKVAENNDVPQVLLSKLLDAEWSAQGMTRHSKVYDKINKILNEEWRSKEQLPEIIEDMKKRREDKNKYK